MPFIVAWYKSSWTYLLYFQRTQSAGPPDHDKLYKFNVSGYITETYLDTFDRFPNSLLGDPCRRKRLWDETRKEFFLDRHRPTFESVYQFYQTGFLRRPDNAPLATFLEELHKYEFEEEIIKAYKHKEGIIVEKPIILPNGVLRRKIWKLLEHPESSIFARAMAVFSLLVVALSIANLCTETIPRYAHHHCLNISRIINGQKVTSHVPNHASPFFILETFCVAWFTLEYSARLIACPSWYRCKFMSNKLNAIDILTIVPYYAILAVIVSTQNCYIAKKSGSVLLLRILRILRILKLTKHFKALQLFVKSLESSLKELKLFFFLTVLGATFLGGSMYVAELGTKGTSVESVPEGMWWAIATMTTVGYGDVYPIGTYGKLVGIFTFIIGCLIIALPTPVIVANFNHFYKSETGRGFDDGIVIK